MTQVDRGAQDWTGRTVRGRDGAKLGKLSEVYPPGAEGGRGTWGVVRSRFGGRKLVPLDGAAADDDRGLQVPVDRADLRTAPDAATGAPDPDTEHRLHQHYAGRGALADARQRQHERFGGMKIGAGFFGWLVAIGLTVLLGAIATGIAAAAGGMGASATAGIWGAVVALAVLLLAYYAGGYVAGRLARFDGARNGLLAWLFGLLATVLAIVAGAVVGSQANLPGQMQLPMPTNVGQWTVGAVVTLLVVALGTLLAAMLGGKAGERFHHRVDRAGADAV